VEHGGDREGHEDGAFIAVFEILKNILIFAAVTFVVTLIGNKMDKKKKLSMSNNN
jgi:hypothetical protein